MNVAILYICTGKYNIFFDHFYASCEKYFLTGLASLHYYIFTDSPSSFPKTDNLTIINKKCEGFPLDSLLRFDMFLRVKNELLDADYVFFFNSNAEFKAPIGIDILPEKGKETLVAAEWPCKRKPFNHPMFYPYERNKKSTAYIPPFEKHPYKYYMGGINGGESKAYVKMIETLAANIREDYNKGIIACVHDESHINKYFRSHTCKVLTPEYCIPEEWVKEGFQPKIIFRNKVKVDSYFNKGRDHSFKGRLQKTIRIIKRAICWYI